MTDISTITPTDTREVELKHPQSEEGLGWFFSLRSPYSDEVKRADREWMNKRLQKKRGQITAESLESAAEAKILAAVCDWRFEGEATFQGETPDFSKTKLREIIRDSNFGWIREFLDGELGDYGSFFKS